MNRPSLPPLRRIADKVISHVIDELRSLLSTIVNERILWGNLVTITFTAGATPVEIKHNLNRQPTGYIVVRRSANITVYDAAGAGLWVQASAAGSATLYVF